MPHRDDWQIKDDMVLAEAESRAILRFLATQSINNDASISRLGRAAVDYLIVSCLIHSGLTNSEFCALRLGDTIVGSGASSFRVRGRKGRLREVLVPQRVSQLVIDYARDIRPRLLPEGVGPNELNQPLVLSERGGQYHRTGLYRRVVRILTQAGFADRASVHLFRHTYGCLAYAHTGGNLLFVQRQLGHAHPQVTTVYARRIQESYPAMAEQVGLALMGEEPASMGNQTVRDAAEVVRSTGIERRETTSRQRRELAIGETD